MARKRVSRSRASVNKASGRNSLKDKIKITWTNLVLFAVLFAFSSLFQKLSSSDFFLYLFETLSILFGFISFALVVALVVLLVIKAIRK